MSRIGKKPVVIPAGVTVELLEGNTLQVKGEKGTLTETFNSKIDISVEAGQVVVSRSSDEKEYRSLHGLTRSLIQNMIDGVTKGYVKELEINGVGYRAGLQGKTLVLNVGFSHQIDMVPPEGIVVEVPSQTKIIIKGINKQIVTPLKTFTIPSNITKTPDAPTNIACNRALNASDFPYP